MVPKVIRSGPHVCYSINFLQGVHHLHQTIRTNDVESMTEGIRAQHPPASKLHNYVVLRMILTASLALLSSSKSRRPTSLDVDEAHAQGTNSGVGHFSIKAEKNWTI
jgi:hypothetical protein